MATAKRVNKKRKVRIHYCYETGRCRFEIIVDNPKNIATNDYNLHQLFIDNDTSKDENFEDLLL